MFIASKSDTSSSPSPYTTVHQIEFYDNDVLRTPKTYHPKYLNDWIPAPTVREKSGKPGEMGQ